MRAYLLLLVFASSGCLALAPSTRSSGAPPFYRLTFANGAVADARTVSTDSAFVVWTPRASAAPTVLPRRPLSDVQRVEICRVTALSVGRRTLAGAGWGGLVGGLVGLAIGLDDTMLEASWGLSLAFFPAVLGTTGMVVGGGAGAASGLSASGRVRCTPTPFHF